MTKRINSTFRQPSLKNVFFAIKTWSRPTWCAKVLVQMRSSFEDIRWQYPIVYLGIKSIKILSKNCTVSWFDQNLLFWSYAFCYCWVQLIQFILSNVFHNDKPMKAQRLENRYTSLEFETQLFKVHFEYEMDKDAFLQRKKIISFKNNKRNFEASLKWKSSNKKQNRSWHFDWQSLTNMKRICKKGHEYKISNFQGEW